jgi:hypothetical protein
MHLRGKSYRFEAHYPDGASETLLDIPQFDFNWQTIYNLKTPKRMPRGTVVACRAVFDNSAENVFNPNPDEVVRWGDQTFEEMMIGYMFVVSPKASPPVAQTRPAADEPPPSWWSAAVAAGAMALLGAWAIRRYAVAA